jgi:hypothetical protein
MSKKNGQFSKSPGNATGKSDSVEPKENIIQLSDVRARRTQENRRKFERFFLRDMMQFFCMVDNRTLPIELLDVSETGCSFRVPQDKRDEDGMKDVRDGSQVSIRIYLSRDTYLLLGMQVLSLVPMTENGRTYVRYGCALDQGFGSYAAFRQMVKFIDTYARVCSREREKNSIRGGSGR